MRCVLELPEERLDEGIGFSAQLEDPSRVGGVRLLSSGSARIVLKDRGAEDDAGAQHLPDAAGGEQDHAGGAVGGQRRAEELPGKGAVPAPPPPQVSPWVDVLFAAVAADDAGSRHLPGVTRPHATRPAAPSFPRSPA